MSVIRWLLGLLTSEDAYEYGDPDQDEDQDEHEHKHEDENEGEEEDEDEEGEDVKRPIDDIKRYTVDLFLCLLMRSSYFSECRLLVGHLIMMYIRGDCVQVPHT